MHHIGDMTKIPSNRHPQIYGENLRSALVDVCKTGRVTKGKYVEMFEQAVKDYYDVEHAISFVFHQFICCKIRGKLKLLGHKVE